MLNTININLKTDIKTDRPTTLPIKLMSQDKNNNQFILRFTNGGEPVSLDDTYTVEILTKFTNSGASRLTSAIVRQDYATWEFDTAYITQDEMVYNYVYVRKAGSLVVSADANAFAFDVGLSEIDKDAGRVAEVYDENYEKILADYSGALDERTTERLDEAVLDFNQRGDAEIADWRVGADVELEDYLADKVQNFKIESLWGSYGSFDIPITGVVAIYAKNDNSLNVGSDNLKSFNLVLGHKYYVKIDLHEDTQVNIDRIVLGNVFVNGLNSKKISIVGTISSTGSNFLYTQSVTGQTGILKYKSGLVVNLTTTFGAGNEPTKIEMDELVKVIPNGWWNGEFSLTQKQLLNWQLKLMRQNRNALIALGGTII